MTQERLEVTLSVPADTPISELASEEKHIISIENASTLTNSDSDSDSNDSQKFGVGEFALDKDEPTPSKEANTVRITEFTGQRANDYVVEETGRTVADHNPRYPSTDRVILGYYTNMSGDNKEFAFPESRLQRL